MHLGAKVSLMSTRQDHEAARHTSDVLRYQPKGSLEAQPVLACRVMREHLDVELAQLLDIDFKV